MLNHIEIGSVMTLDLKARILKRLSDGKSVTLPASACRCLQAMVEASGEVLSHEQLLDIGWRSSGIEVTNNSVRVMINKLRHALYELVSQQEVSLLAVSGSGYRLLIHSPTPTHFREASSQQSVEKHDMLSETLPPLAASQPFSFNHRWVCWSAAGIIGLIIGLILALIVGFILYNQLQNRLEHIEYLLMHGPCMPEHVQIFFPGGRLDS
jgi:DNA-binding winged helix-turn-helix (wHTH) protein